MDGTLVTTTRIRVWDIATAVDGNQGYWKNTSGDPDRTIDPGPDLNGESSKTDVIVQGNISWRMPGGKAKFFFVDGHVEVMRPEDVKLRHVNGRL